MRDYVRKMRILAYNQLLESYRSLTLDSLARSFGVSVDFVDKCVSPPFLFPSSAIGQSADRTALVANSRDSLRQAGYTARSTR